MLIALMMKDYVGLMKGIFSTGGEMIVAVDESGAVAGVSVFRSYFNTLNGCRFYIDDLVTDERRRSGGVGSVLVNWLCHEALSRGTYHSRDVHGEIRRLQGPINGIKEHRLRPDGRL